MNKYLFFTGVILMLLGNISCSKSKDKKEVKQKTALPTIKEEMTEELDSTKFLVFKINPADTLSWGNIDFTREKPKCEFELKGKFPLKYYFQLQNDSIASLYQFKNDEFQFQENMNYQSFFWEFKGDVFLSKFKITDFDNDGDEDLVCWVSSNINGNEWTIIFINDQKQQKLVKLHNTVEDTDIWNRPQFDKKNNIINCTRDGSAFGTSEESSYKLQDDFTIIPLKKHYEDRTKEQIYDYEYIGKNGKWKLISKTK